jgi:uncharacterized lipoprotein
MIPMIQRVEGLIVTCMLTVGSGCVLTQERVKLSYVPQVGVQRVERPNVSGVVVSVVDSRPTKDRVSSKENAFGMKLGAITSEEDVATLLQSAVEIELENRGFHLGSGKALVNVELSRLENDFGQGFFSGDAMAELFMRVTVQEAASQVLYRKFIQGKGINSGIQLASGANAKIALDRALQDAVSKLFQDSQFLESVVKAAAGT